MTDVVRLPDIEPNNFELLMEIFYCYIGDKDTPEEHRKHAIWLCNYIKKGTKVY